MSNVTFSGIGSSIDTKSIVTAIVNAEVQPQQQLLDSRKTTVNNQLSAIGKLKSALETFQKSLDNMKTSSDFQVRSATSSDTTLLDVSADGTAVPGSYQVVVDHLAEQQKLITAAGSFATSSDTVGTGTLSFSVGSNSFNVTIDSTNSTLAGVRDAINNASGNSSVTATIVNVDNGSGGTEARLELTSKDGGVANKITVTAADNDGNSTDAAGLSRLTYDSSSATGNMTELQAAKDSLIHVDGLAVTSSTNSVTDAVSGLTLNLKSADPTKTLNVDVAVDNTSIEKNVQSFVDAYNTLHSVINSVSGSKNTSALFGDSTVRAIYNQIRSTLGSPVASSTSSNNMLGLVGVSIDENGTMSLDSAKLSKTLTSDYSSVSQIFTNSDGIAPTLSSVLKNYTQYSGLLDDRTKGLNDRLSSISDSQDRLTRYQDSLTASLTKQYNAMDSLVAQINSTGSYLSAQLSKL